MCPLMGRRGRNGRQKLEKEEERKEKEKRISKKVDAMRRKGKIKGKNKMGREGKRISV